MDNRFDLETVVAILFGTILMTTAYFYLTGNKAVPDIWLMQIMATVVVTISAVYGTISGCVMPLAAYLIVQMAGSGRATVPAMLFLAVFGAATGHYGRRFRIREGKFNGIYLFDYAVIEAVLAILVWVCIYPLSSFYLRMDDLRGTLLKGVGYCGISIINKICVCLPILLLLNAVFKKRSRLREARDEYMYERQ